MSVVTGIVQLVVVEADMLQSVIAVANLSSSAERILTMYPVIGEPPLSGATHATITLSGFHVVVGVYGYAGS